MCLSVLEYIIGVVRLRKKKIGDWIVIVPSKMVWFLWLNNEFIMNRNQTQILFQQSADGYIYRR